MKKKFSTFLFALPFILTGCRGGGSYDADNFLPDGTEENPYQIVKNKVTINIFAPHSAGNPEYKDLKMFKHLSKITNLDFNFTTPDSSAYTNMKATIWASQGRNRQDLFLFNNSISEMVQYDEKGFDAYVPFNDDNYSDSTGKIGNLIDQYMPYYKKGLEENFGESKENAKEVVEVGEKKTMYSTLSVKNVSRDLTYKMFINEAWIKNLAKDKRTYIAKNNIKTAADINTIDQYLGVLRDFRDFDANGNGDATDEVPVTAKEMEYLRNFLLAAYGYVSPQMEIESDKSKYTFVATTDAYRNYLKTARLMYDEGLLQKSVFSTTDSTMKTDGMRGRLGSFVAAAPYLITGQEKDKYLKDEAGNPYVLDEEYVTFGPLTSDFYTGSKIHLGFGVFSPDGAAIPYFSIYKREVARLIDIMYSPIGQQLIAYGVEGEDWKWNDDDHTSWTFLIPETWNKSSEDYRATITPNVGSASALYWNKDFVEKMKDPTIERLNEQSSLYVPYFKVPEPKEYKFTATEYADISTIKAVLDPKMEYYEASFVTGDGGANPKDNASWNKFVSEITTFSTKGGTSTTLADIYNGMLKRYQ